MASKKQTPKKQVSKKDPVAAPWNYTVSGLKKGSKLISLRGASMPKYNGKTTK
jgi:hypothetical protein